MAQTPKHTLFCHAISGVQNSNHLLGLSPVCFSPIGAEVFQGKVSDMLSPYPFVQHSQTSLPQSLQVFVPLNLSLSYSGKDICETCCRFQPNSTASSERALFTLQLQGQTPPKHRHFDPHNSFHCPSSPLLCLKPAPCRSVFFPIKGNRTWVGKVNFVPFAFRSGTSLDKKQKSMPNILCHLILAQFFLTKNLITTTRNNRWV